MLEIAMVSSNRRYTDRFVRYVRASPWNDKVRMHLFSNLVSCREFRTTVSTSPLFIMIDEAVSETDLPMEAFTGDQVFRLTSRKDVPSEPHIYMYQPVSSILQTLYSAYLESEQAGALTEGEGREDRSSGNAGESMSIITVVSPYGGCGVTTIAIQLARSMAMRQGKVLYVNMELYPEPVIVPEIDYDFSRLLYMLTTRPEELEKKWQLYCGRHESTSVFCFRPATVRRDLRDVKTEHINQLFEMFQRLGFTSIVLDADAHWLDDIVEGKLRYDECWLVAPWDRRHLRNFPQLREFISRKQVRYVINQVQEQHISQGNIGEEADIVLPYIRSSGDGDALFTNERLEGMIVRYRKESVLTGGLQ